jgi:Endosomal/lysosomal potassium channel TMEM175
MWSADGWATTNRSETADVQALSLWFSDLPTEGLPGGSLIEFTFFWEEAQRWEGRNWQVQVS